MADNKLCNPDASLSALLNLVLIPQCQHPSGTTAACCFSHSVAFCGSMCRSSSWKLKWLQPRQKKPQNQQEMFLG